MKLFLFVAFVVAFKLLTNLLCYIRIKKLNKYFREFLLSDKDDIYLLQQEVLSLFKRAGIKDVLVPAAQAVGYNMIATGCASAFSAFPTRNKALVGTYLTMFDAACGVFRKNMFDALNPIYWIELVVFLPRTALEYIGIDAEKTAFKLCNILLTFLWWLLCVSVIFFKPHLKEFIVELLGKF